MSCKFELRLHVIIYRLPIKQNLRVFDTCRSYTKIAFDTLIQDLVEILLEVNIFFIKSTIFLR